MRTTSLGLDRAVEQEHPGCVTCPGSFFAFGLGFGVYGESGVSVE